MSVRQFVSTKVKFQFVGERRGDLTKFELEALIVPKMVCLKTRQFYDFHDQVKFVTRITASQLRY